MLSAETGRGSERRRRDAEQDARHARPRVGVPMRDARGMGDSVAALEAVVLRPDPEIERALEHHDDLLVGVVGIRLVAGPAAWLDRRVDDLEAPVRAAGQELIHGTEALVDDLASIVDTDDGAG